MADLPYIVKSDDQARELVHATSDGHITIEPELQPGDLQRVLAALFQRVLGGPFWSEQGER